MQIGEVAERTGLSLRTIGFYDEVGLVAVPALEQVGAESAGLVSADAKLALRRWRKGQSR